MQDTVLKVALPVLSAAILGLFGWIWNTSTHVTLMQSDIQYIQKEQEEAKKLSSDLMEKVDSNRIVLIELQRDMKYIKITLSNIESAVDANER